MRSTFWGTRSRGSWRFREWDVLLQNKTILITGASRGIGLAIAKELAAQGARLILTARQPREMQGHETYSVHVGQQASVEAMAQWCTARYPHLDGIVNCAGIYGPIGRLGDIDVDDFVDTLQVNLVGTVRVCHALLPLLLKAPRGKIVNLSGGGAATPFARYSAYACSKVAVVRLTENLSLEYPELDVNCVAPGFVATELHRQTLEAGPDRASPEFYEATQKQMASGGVPADKAARLTAFLLSSASDGISGRFLAAPWDPWEQPEFQQRLRTDPGLARLRRIDDKGFRSVG